MNSRRFILLFVLAGLYGRPARAEDTLPPSIIHEACAEYMKGKPFDVIARFEDESQLFDPKVMYRSGADSHWKQVAFVKESGSEDFKATIKAKDLKGALEYFIEVFDEFGNGPARMGSPEAPIKVEASKSPEVCDQVPKTKAMTMTTSSAPIPAPTDNGTKTATTTPTTTTTTAQTTTGKNIMTQPVPAAPQGPCDQADRPLYCEPWLWATLGIAVVAAGGVGIYFALKPTETPPPGRESVRLNVSGPDPIAVAPDP